MIELLDYELPEELIAQEPAAERSDARLLVLDRASGLREHRGVRDLPSLLRPGDLLVVNDTRVLPARLRARRASGGAIEIFLLEPLAENAMRWTCLVQPGKTVRRGGPFELVEAPDVSANLVEDASTRTWTVELRRAGLGLDRDAVELLCDAIGETPLPPYIRREPTDRTRSDDRERYQTIWAERRGAVAAPTAGLHFTPGLLAELDARGIERVAVTLHVGQDTFRPLSEEVLKTGRLHGERVEISRESIERIRSARRDGRRIVAVGTTTVRALESLARRADGDSDAHFAERTTLFIRPGHEFRLVDALITNFHLPRSSLLLLVSAFASRESILAAYHEAVRERYRFFSFGDAMLIT
jgi:S-adenosylmethionine:tRNA ribosyltransferase-isomerase